MIDASLNEVESLCYRVVRGAGGPWGEAEEAANAARWLAARGLPWAEPLLALATGMAPPERASGVHGGTLSALAAGSAVSDGAAPSVPARLARVVAPVLLIPFFARVAARNDNRVILAWDGVEIAVDGHGAHLSAGAPADLAAPGPIDVTCRLANPAASDRTAPAPSDLTTRAPVPVHIWDALTRIGARTYVAASEQSRLTGAGAGTSDND